MNEVKVCPKCNGEMEEGATFGGMQDSTIWLKLDEIPKGFLPKRIPTRKVFNYACVNCGFVERYVERNNSERLAAVND